MIEKYLSKGKWREDQFLVSSFNHPEISAFRKLSPQIRTGGLIAHIPLDYARFAEDLGAYSVNANLEFINKNLVEDAHRRGMKIFVYTVNHPEDVSRVKKLNVDGIYSDFPDILSK